MEILRLAVAVLCWPATLGVLAAALLAQGGRFSARLDLLTHAAPLYLVVAMAAVLSCGLAPRGSRLPLLAAGLAAVVASAALLAPEMAALARARPAPAGGVGEMKLVQFNAWGANATPETAVAWILAQDADIVVVEEVGRVGPLLLAAGYHGSCLGCGVEIFSRLRPVAEMSVPPRSDGDLAYLGGATFRDARGDFAVIGVHRYWPSRFKRARAQAADLDAVVARFPKARLIVAGDFNSTPWSFARRREDRAWSLTRRTRALATWPAARVSHNRLPAPLPYLPIDHVYAGPGWSTVRVERGPRLGSDHYPVVVTLTPVDAGGR